MSKERKLLIENPIVAFVVFMGLFMGSNFIVVEGTVQYTLYAFQLISLFYMLIVYVFKFKISIYFLLVISFIGVRIFSNVYNGLPIYFVLTQSVTILLSVLFVEILGRKNPKVLLQSIFWGLLIANVINFISIYALPDGFYLDEAYPPRRVFLFGIANQQGIVLLFSIGIFLLVSKKEKGLKRILALFGAISVLINCFIIGSSTLILATALLLMYILFILSTRLYKFISMTSMVILYYISWILIVVVKISQYMSLLFVDILGKSTDLNFRTILWDKALTIISFKPFLGYGTTDGLYITRIIGTTVVRQSSHNLFLQLLLEGGVVTLTVFTIILLVSARKLSKYNSDHYAAILSISVIAILFLSISEVYTGMAPLYILISMTYMYPHIREYLVDSDKHVFPKNLKQSIWLGEYK
ncbi:O-antigen ligase family protein [Enterococcus larvae]|uniref:O-antigen ligase family protein n=1 Tax=Enterococcus larvae TaxID=2794352 RepID=UPI003F31205D